MATNQSTPSESVHPAFAATFATTEPINDGSGGNGDNARTIVDTQAPQGMRRPGTEATLAGGPATAQAAGRGTVTASATATANATGAGRTTVLPWIAVVDAAGDDDQEIVPIATSEARTRYEHLKQLGAGGMGEVDLAQDNDIGRKVALKRLLPEATHGPGLARFVDEIRTIGQLEHPNIVPIHDVGVDDQGRYFFVMKFVDGQTLESIIEKLNAGDEKLLAKYTFEYRIQIFMGLLRALEYAHAHGIVHRDLKPANVMVGPFGEVILMDWGIAKAVKGREAPPVEAPVKDAHGGTVKDTAAGNAAAGADTKNNAGEERARMYTTRHGSLLGTPAYMSPEQAAGHNDRIDERSDVYSASVVFHELLYLKHYLADKPTLAAMLLGVMEQEMTFIGLVRASHPHQSPVPAELVHFVRKGLSKDPAARWQSAGEMVAGLEAILEGRVTIQCHVTFTKRLARELGRVVDRHPQLAFATLATTIGAICFSGFRLLSALVR